MKRLIVGLLSISCLMAESFKVRDSGSYNYAIVPSMAVAGRKLDIDWSNPITQGLRFAVVFNQGSGVPEELVSGLIPTSGTQNWKSTKWGFGQFINKSSTNAYRYPTGTRLDFNPEQTIAAVAMHELTYNAGINESFAQFVPSGIGDSRLDFFKHNSTHKLNYRTNTVAVEATNLTVQQSSDALLVAVVSHDQVTARFSLNCEFQEVSFVRTISDPTLDIQIGSAQAFAGPWGGTVFAVYVWNRILQKSEHCYLAENPMAPLRSLEVSTRLGGQGVFPFGILNNPVPSVP